MDSHLSVPALRLHPLGQCTADELSQLRQCYCTSFPPDEQRPWEQIAGIDQPDGLRPIAVRDAGLVVGLVVLWEVGQWRFVEYIVTFARLRGRGYGAAIMKCIAHYEACERPIVLEVERPEQGGTMAGRRIAFYERVGLRLQPFDYYQPPYTAETQAVPMRLMSSVDITPQGYRALRTDIYREVYGRDAEG